MGRPADRLDERDGCAAAADAGAPEVIEFHDHNGDVMIPLRCQLCGEQIGLRSPGPDPDPDFVVARCYACAALEEAESITEGSA
jgi:hypothetical protein